MPVDLTTQTVLVTGANGFVGARTVERLAELGMGVRALVRREGTAPVVAGVTEVVGDVLDADDVAGAVDGVDVVVHTAAAAGPDWDAVRRVNRDATALLADAALDAGVSRFVHISTFSVYDRSPELEVITEETATVDPDAEDANPYAVTKLEAEQVLAERADAGLAVVVLRPPAVLGHAPTSTWGQKVPAGVRDGDLLMNQPEAAHLAYVHVDDLVTAVVAALRAEEVTAGRAYDVVHDVVRWGDYLRDLHDLFDDAPPLPDFPEGEAWTGGVQHDRLSQELGFSPSRPYSEALDEIRRAWRQQG